MRLNDKAIVLSTVKHADRKYIVRLYSCSHGIITAFAIPGKSQSAKIKTSHLMPLNLLEVNLVQKQNKEMSQLTEANCYFVNTGFTGNITKLSIAQLITEVLAKCLKEQSASQELFLFIESVIKFLIGSESEFLNLHLYFLRELASYLGFEPQNNFGQDQSFFDCREGKFTPVAMAFPLGLNRKDSELFSRFLHVDILREKFSRTERQVLLESLSGYYCMHVPGFNELQSVEVLRNVLE